MSASIATMNRPIVTIAHTQLTPTTSSASARARGVSSPGSASASSSFAPRGRFVSGAPSVTSSMTANTPAMNRYTPVHDIRAARNSANAPPTIDAVR